MSLAKTSMFMMSIYIRDVHVQNVQVPWYILSIQSELEESCLQYPLLSLDFLVAGTDCDLDKLLETVTKLKELHPQLKVCSVGETLK